MVIVPNQHPQWLIPYFLDNFLDERLRGDAWALLVFHLDHAAKNHVPGMSVGGGSFFKNDILQFRTFDDRRTIVAHTRSATIVIIIFDVLAGPNPLLLVIRFNRARPTNRKIVCIDTKAL